MELFYSRDISNGDCTLDAQESNHCIKVLRHRVDDIINIVDGVGNMYECRITDASHKCVRFDIISTQESWGAHPYYLHMAVAPPKNIERFEWFAEKATEIGLDRITPLFGEHSERKIFKKERCERIVISAAKQSHKGAIPTLDDAITVKDFLRQEFDDCQKYICYCDDVSSLGGTKSKIIEALANSDTSKYVVMIGPEGDFSRDEITIAIENGWHCISLGDSRLRIETAALTAVSAIYLKHI
jgi:16S rRNA (uracil1498-N3)-methyltransferase